MKCTTLDIINIMRCPRCLSVLTSDADQLVCSNTECGLSNEPFLTIAGQPVLIDFETSIVDRCSFENRAGGSTKERDETGRSIKTKLFRALFGANRALENLSHRFIADLARTSDSKPRILIVGGGEIGTGMTDLYTDPTIDLIGFDIYVSSNTAFVADGHRIPLADASVDGVVVEAVLEHVLDPAQVVAEIYRVSKPGGLVLADSPFMQQVHEGTYDFTRFTLSGHRWLFRHFSLIDAGVSSGPGSAALWNIRYFFRAILRNDKLGTAIQMACFWLRYFDKLPLGRMAADAASGVFFYGRKSDEPIKPIDMVKFYEMQERL
jgi:SAM-dependent methyltransferase